MKRTIRIVLCAALPVVLILFALLFSVPLATHSAGRCALAAGPKDLLPRRATDVRPSDDELEDPVTPIPLLREPFSPFAGDPWDDPIPPLPPPPSTDE